MEIYELGQEFKYFGNLPEQLEKYKGQLPWMLEDKIGIRSRNGLPPIEMRMCGLMNEDSHPYLTDWRPYTPPGAEHEGYPISNEDFDSSTRWSKVQAREVEYGDRILKWSLVDNNYILYGYSQSQWLEELLRDSGELLANDFRFGIKIDLPDVGSAFSFVEVSLNLNRIGFGEFFPIDTGSLADPLRELPSVNYRKGLRLVVPMDPEILSETYATFLPVSSKSRSSGN